MFAQRAMEWVMDLQVQGGYKQEYVLGSMECLSLRWRSSSFSVGQPSRWYLQSSTGHLNGRVCALRCLFKSHSRGYCLPHCWHT